MTKSKFLVTIGVYSVARCTLLILTYDGPYTKSATRQPKHLGNGSAFGQSTQRRLARPLTLPDPQKEKKGLALGAAYGAGAAPPAPIGG